MTTIKEQTVDLAALGYEPRCEYVNPANQGGDCGGRNLATRLLIKKQPRLCRHDVDWYICDGCWAIRNGGNNGNVQCRLRGCGSLSVPALSNIAQVVRLR